MMREKRILLGSMIAIVMLSCSVQLYAGESLEVNFGADLVSRYNWRGLDFGNAPSIQPSLSFGYFGFELGFWGAYTFTDNASANDEIDTWLGYTYTFENEASVTALVTDYYFPNAGIRLGNFNDYDDPDGSGAHTFEAGLSITGPASLPLTLSGYINIYNDAGNNVYIQADYALAINEAELGFYVGATTGSEENPDYYGSDSFAIINVGISASKDIKVTDSFSLPAFVAYSINPRLEQSYIIFGLSF